MRLINLITRDIDPTIHHNFLKFYFLCRYYTTTMNINLVRKGTNLSTDTVCSLVWIARIVWKFTLCFILRSIVNTQSTIKIEKKHIFLIHHLMETISVYALVDFSRSVSFRFVYRGSYRRYVSQAIFATKILTRVRGVSCYGGQESPFLLQRSIYTWWCIR